ncbi:MAG: Sua5/YciO/YrdC/YwlC family protein, partial [Bacteroidales bacterium]|nr:Sua5/YciO/YrdC/YwlC family protein [Bacteroidales bacterium]
MTDFSQEIECLRSGGILLYPTDTVWGIGCDATCSEAVSKVFALKKRAESKSLVLLVSDEDMLCKYIREVPSISLDLVRINPDPMTII